ncbi:hypothetical protein [Candidatus Coxiella mudrowiae]|nr:hypothetical protein [Candidatus Coxiella mudrowiae]
MSGLVSVLGTVVVEAALGCGSLITRPTGS